MDIIELGALSPQKEIKSRQITSGEELEMVKKFIAFKEEIFHATPHRRLAVFMEPHIHDTYPDVILVEYDANAFEYWSENRCLLEINDWKILHYIYIKHRVSIERISRNLSINVRNVSCSLEKIFNAGMIENKGSFWTIKNRRNLFAVKRIESVEAKIGSWNKVVEQAVINTAFASESSILIKRKRGIGRIKEEESRALGIGVYGFNGDIFTTYVKPQNNAFPLNLSAIKINELLASVLIGKK